MRILWSLFAIWVLGLRLFKRVLGLRLLKWVLDLRLFWWFIFRNLLCFDFRGLNRLLITFLRQILLSIIQPNNNWGISFQLFLFLFTLFSLIFIFFDVQFVCIICPHGLIHVCSHSHVHLAVLVITIFWLCLLLIWIAFLNDISLLRYHWNVRLGRSHFTLTWNL